jgi:methionine synthase II (cobalamin-independent)
MTPQLHRNPPFRAEHLGSLLRTDELLKTKTAFEKKEVPEVDLVAVENKDIKEVAEVQKKLGYAAISDGEYRRHSKRELGPPCCETRCSQFNSHLVFWGSFFSALDGFEEVRDINADVFRPYAPDVAAFLEAGHKPGESVICTGKVKHTHSTYVDEFKYLASVVPHEEVKSLKITLAAPNWYHLRYKEGKAYPKDVYSTDDEYFADIARAYQAELQILYDAGCRNVQFDDPNLACKSPDRHYSTVKWPNSDHIYRLLLRKDARWLEKGSIERPYGRRDICEIR